MANSSRIDVIVIIVFAAIGFIIPFVVSLRHFIGIDSLAMLHITWGRTVVGSFLPFWPPGFAYLTFI